MLKSICSALLLALVTAGCHSDAYYRSQAAEKARKYLLENCKELSTEESLFVRYNPPVMLHAPLLGGTAEGRPETERLDTQLHQICAAWMIPGRKDLVMVYGVSNARMDFWEPQRVLIRDYSSHIPAYQITLGNARGYTLRNLAQELSVKERNFIRFSYPEMRRTNFAANFNKDGKKPDEELAPLLENYASRTQYSMVWKLGENRNLVVVGLADRMFTVWDVVLGDIMDDETLNRHTEAVILTPAQGADAMPDKELDKLSGWEE